MLIVSNTWNIVMGVFEAAQSVVNSASGLIVGDTSINLADHIADLEARLLEMNVWTLLGLWLQSFVVGFTMWGLTICIFIIIYGRMIEIYLVTSIAPIPMATMMGKEWGRIISAPCWLWRFRAFSSSSASPSMRCWYRICS